MAFNVNAEGGGKPKLDFEILPTGTNLATLYGVADLGTHDHPKFGPKRRLLLAYEFPQELRQFYEGDDMKPLTDFVRENMFMNSKANLRKKWVEPMYGKAFTSDKEASAFDLETLIGKSFIATIVHRNGKGNNADKTYANISSISTIDDRMMKAFDLTTDRFGTINNTFSFHIGSDGFESQKFANLPKFIRNEIMQSQEAQEHRAGGGTFAEPDSNGSSGSSSSSGASSGKKLVMLETAPFPYEEFKKQDWTDQQLVDNGYAVWETVQAPKPPSAPAAPSAPSAPKTPTAFSAPASPATAPQAPQQAAPAAPPKPSIPPADDNKPKEGVDFFFKINPDQNQDISVWESNGWTKPEMVASNYAKWVDSDGNETDPDLPF